MPIYEYECTVNRHRFEKWQSMQDEPLKTCIVCGSPVRKVLSAAGIIFKGSGWYITDSRKPASSESKSDSKQTETKSDSGGGETKAEKPSSDAKTTSKSED